MTDPDIWDVVVIGGGSAGLSGALALARSRRSVLVVDSGEPRNAPSAHVHNYLTRDGAPPAEIYGRGRDEVLGYGGRVESGRVTGLARDGETFRVQLAERSVLARRVLIATGSRDELPDLPGLAERWGIDVLHCPYCHGWEVRDQRIGVLAGSPMAMHQVLMFRQLSSDVSLLPIAGFRPDEEQLEELAALGVPVRDAEVVGVEVGAQGLSGVRLADRSLVPLDALVVAPRCFARAELLGPVGLEADEVRVGEVLVGTQVEADPTGATAVPGVWVAGNVANPMAHVVSSSASGVAAGAAINADLIAEDAGRAVRAYRDGTDPAAGGMSEPPAIALDMVVIDTDDPAGLSRFYSALLDLPIVEEDEDWVTLRGADGRSLAFQLTINHRRPTWPSADVPQQYHLDLRVSDLERAGAYAESLGARRVPNAGGESFVVYTDPSGHPFCLCR